MTPLARCGAVQLWEWFTFSYWAKGRKLKLKVNREAVLSYYISSTETIYADRLGGVKWGFVFS
jgi:hypothetical protein